MKTPTVAVIVALVLTLANVEGANLRQLASKHASSPMMGRMEAHKTTIARMESHKITQTKMEAHKMTQTKMDAHKTTSAKMESQLKFPLINWGNIFSKPTQMPVTTAPPKAAITTAPPILAPPVETEAPTPEPTDESSWYLTMRETVAPQRPPSVGSYPRNNQYNPTNHNDY